MTNNIFHPARFYQLMARNLKQNPKSWMLSIAILAGFPVLFFVLNAAQIGFHITSSDRASLLRFFASAAFIFSPFILFYNYNHPKKGLTEVMLPASILEKNIAMQISCIILTPLAVFLLFGIPDTIFALIFPKIYSGYAVPEALKDFFSWNNLSTNFISLQLVLFFNLLFVRRKILKTLGVSILTLIIFMTIVGTGIAIWDSQNSFTDTENFNLDLSDRPFYAIYANDHPIVIIIQVTRIIVQGVLPVLLVIGSYFVMKNKRY